MGAMTVADDAQRDVTGPGAPATLRLSGPDRDRLVRLAYRFLWNRDDAEDAAHSAIAAAQQRAGDLRDSAKLWSWLCRIVVQQCHLMARSKARWARHQPRIAAVAPGAASDEDASVTELAGLIRDLLPHLPPRQREVVVLRHLEGMSFEQVAEVLKIAPATARVHAQAAREKLRELIRRQHAELLDERS